MARVYISGPMTGLPDLNRSAFEAAAEELRGLGHEPVIPGDLHPSDTPYVPALKNAIRALLDCDHIVLLPGWSKSKGATLERDIAWALEIRTITLEV